MKTLLTASRGVCQKEAHYLKGDRNKTRTENKKSATLYVCEMFTKARF